MQKFLLTFLSNPLFLVIYTIILVLFSYYYIFKNKESIFSCVKLFFIFYLVFIALGPILLLLHHKFDYRYNYNVYFLFLLAIGFFFFGSYVRKKYAAKKKNQSHLKEKHASSWTLNYPRIYKVSLFVLFLSYSFCCFYIIKNFSFLLSDFENNRILAMQGSGVVIHLAYAMIPATWVLYYCHLHHQKNKFIYGIFLIDVLLLLFIGFRSRILELILMAIILKNDDKEINFKRLLRYGILLVLLVSLLQYIRMLISPSTDTKLVGSIVNTLGVGSINLKSIFATFPSRTPFQYGYTYLINFFQLLPSSSMDMTLWLKEQLQLSFAGGGVTPTILGEFYINFGMIGIFIGMFLLGFLCRLIDDIIKTKKVKLIWFILMFYLCRSVTSGVSNFVILATWFIFLTFVMLYFSNILEFLQPLIRKFQKVMMRILSNVFMPILKPRPIVLLAHGMNTFDGSPKYLFLELEAWKPLNFEFYWITQNKKLWNQYKTIYPNFLYSFSFRSLFLILKAKIFVTSISIQDIYPGLQLSNHRIMIQTWHATPIKTIMRGADRFYSKREIEKQINSCFNPHYTYVVSAGEYEDIAYQKCCDVKEEQLLKFGQPRSDRFENWEFYYELFRKKLPFSKDNQCILYCPTWRELDDFILLPFDDQTLMDFDQFLIEHHLIFIVKLHPLYGAMNESLSVYQNIIAYSATWQLDNQELLLAMDLVITDYSSMFYDFLLTEKPVLFLPYDKEQYFQTRGINFEYEEAFPGPQPSSFQELEDELLHLLKDPSYYLEKRQEVNRKFNGYNSFHASESLIDFIQQKIQEEKS